MGFPRRPCCRLTSDAVSARTVVSPSSAVMRRSAAVDTVEPLAWAPAWPVGSLRLASPEGGVLYLLDSRLKLLAHLNKSS
jgi:hypothetical protein